MKRTKFLGNLLMILLIGIQTVNAQTEYKLDQFDEIIATGTVDVILQKGTTHGAVVKATGIDNGDINVDVSEGILKIRVLKSLLKKGDKVEVFVTYSQIRKIKAQAGADIVAKSILTGDQLMLRANSGSEIMAEIAVNKLEAVAAEGGEINLKGKAQTQDIRTSSGGQFNAFNLICDYTYATANTGGTAKVVAKQTLEASANTGGVIEYKGNPEKTKMKELLQGKVKEI